MPGQRQVFDDVRRGIDDVRRGMIPADIYNDAEFFELEKERLFNRGWLFVSHESEIPQDGDYVVRRVLNDSFIKPEIRRARFGPCSTCACTAGCRSAAPRRAMLQTSAARITAGPTATTAGLSACRFSAVRHTEAALFGLTIVSCERAILRQSENGVFVYDEDGMENMPVTGHSGRAAELMQVYDAVFNDKPTFHDGHWGKGTVELCQVIEPSAKEQRSVELQFQVPRR